MSFTGGLSVLAPTRATTYFTNERHTSSTPKLNFINFCHPTPLNCLNFYVDLVGQYVRICPTNLQLEQVGRARRRPCKAVSGSGSWETLERAEVAIAISWASETLVTSGISSALPLVVRLVFWRSLDTRRS
jgi:hypothetical protein